MDQSMVQIRPVTLADAGGIAAIYNPYVLGTWVSFETEAVAAATMAQRIAEVQSATLPWLVAEDRKSTRLNSSHDT